MAKVSIEVDTSKKTGSVKIDGKNVKDVSSVFLSLDDFFNVEISSIEKLDDDTIKVTRVVAEKQGYGNFAEAAKQAKASEEFPGMYEYVLPSKDYTTAELATKLLRRKVE